MNGSAHTRRPPTTSPIRGVAGGFTIIELMLSLSLGAVLLVALATTAGLFGAQSGEIVKEIDRDLEEALMAVTMDVQEAWLVERTSDTSLDVVDALGGVTTYWLENDTFRMRRPDGETGSLLSGVDDVSFGVGTMSRLRDAAPVTAAADVFQRTVDAPEPLVIPILGGETVSEESVPYYTPDIVPGVLLNGDAMGLGLRITSDAPEALWSLDGVPEEVTGAYLDTLVLSVGFMEELPTPPLDAYDLTGEPDPDDLKPGSDGKTTLCHIPPGNTSQLMTLSVGKDALAGHLDHGDTAGKCPPIAGALTVELYEARGLDDGRPYGGPLGSVSFPAGSLPAATGSFAGIWASGAAVVYDPDASFVVEAPTEEVALDVSTLALLVEPGVPYTVLLRYEGSGAVYFRSATGTGAAGSGVAQLAADGTTLDAVDVTVERTVQGDLIVTQTEEHPVVNRVTTTIELDDGTELSGSSIVATQAAVTEPWYGAVPGEVPDLVMRGQ